MIPLEWMPPLMFGGLVVFMIIGYPVAFSLCAVGFFFGFLSIEMGYFTMAFMQAIPGRVFGSILSNELLLAIPFFTFMGAILERCGLAEDLLEEQSLEAVLDGVVLRALVFADQDRQRGVLEPGRVRAMAGHIRDIVADLAEHLARDVELRAERRIARVDHEEQQRDADDFGQRPGQLQAVDVAFERAPFDHRLHRKQPGDAPQDEVHLAEALIELVLQPVGGGFVVGPLQIALAVTQVAPAQRRDQDAQHQRRKEPPPFDIRQAAGTPKGANL